MATIPHPFLFRWDSVDQLGDLERLKLVLDALPDESLMQLLEADRGHGRNDYPVRPMWNSLIAGFVFQHPSIAALRRELLRNGQLRDLCGFDPFDGARAVPSEYAYTRFQRRLRKHHVAGQPELPNSAR
ncbi:MAG: transposase [Spirochaetaceae bacterium]|nr:transposase [Spirochaetaceae bacterium]